MKKVEMGYNINKKPENMTVESFITKINDNIGRIPVGASVLGAPIPDKKLTKEFEQTLEELVAAYDNATNYYLAEVERIEKVVCDMQHLTVFAKMAMESGRNIVEFLGGDKELPTELKGVALEEYGTVLVNALYKRRQLKDTSIMFKVTKERLEQTLRFIRGMNTRTYELRSKGGAAGDY